MFLNGKAKGSAPETGSLVEKKSPKFVAELLDLLWIVGSAKTLSQLKELFLLLAASFNAQLDELHKNTVVAQAAALCQVVDLPGDLCREGNASADLFRWHSTNIHHYGAQDGS
jgi:hypothetical protein